MRRIEPVALLVIVSLLSVVADGGEVITDLAYGPAHDHRYDWYKPDVSSGVNPVVVYQHGAHGATGSKEDITIDAQGALLPLLLLNGFTVLSIDDQPFPQQIYPTQIDDVGLAIRYFRHNATSLGIDPDRLALWGHSSGSTIGALVAYGDDYADPNGTPLEQESSRPQLFLNWRGQTNWLLMTPAYPGIMFNQQYLGQVDPALLAQASGAVAIVAVPRTFTPPVFSYFGTVETPPPLDNPHDVTLMKDLHQKLLAFPEATAQSVMAQSHVFPGVAPSELQAQAVWLLKRFAIPAALNVGQGLGTALGQPTLQATGTFTPGSPYTITCHAAVPSAALSMIIGPSAVNLPLKGGTLVPQPTLVVSIPTDANGDVVVSGVLPLDQPSGASYLQFWHADPNGVQGASASNAILITVAP